MEEPALERFPLRGKWMRRLAGLYIFLFIAPVFLPQYSGVLGAVLAVVLLTMGAVWLLTELYVQITNGEYIEVRPDGILLSFGVRQWGRRILYETISSVQTKDHWSDRAARALLRIVGRSHPPGVELRFRRRVFLGIWPVMSVYFTPRDPEAALAAISARLGTA